MTPSGSWHWMEGTNHWDTHARAGEILSMNVSPAVVWSDDITFKAIVGHEMIHIHHFYTVPNFKETFTENIAYKYTHDVYMNAGYIEKALSIKAIATRLGYWNVTPPIEYNILPLPINYH